MLNKKATALVAISAAALLGLSACASDNQGGGNDKDGYEVAFIQGVAGDEFYITMECGIKELAKESDVEVSVQGPTKFDSSLQKPIVDSVVASKPDAILIAPNDVKAMQAPIKAATDAGIKVVLVDTTLEDTSKIVSEVSSDNVGGGEEAFAAIKQLNPDGGKVLAVSLDPGISTTDARVEGFKNAAEKDSKFEYLGVQYGHNDPTETAKIVSAALAKDKDIVGIFAVNLFSAEGTATGVKQAGLDGKVSIVSFDAGPAQIKQLEQGAVQALIAQEPADIGKQGLEQAIASLKGEKVEKKIQTGFFIITKENLSGEGDKYVYKSGC